MIEVELNQALHRKHSPPQASEAGRPVASFGVTPVCQPTEEAVEYSCPNFQHLKVSTRVFTRVDAETRQGKCSDDRL